MHDPNTPAESDESRSQLPDALTGALGRTSRRSLHVPPETDDAIRAAAHTILSNELHSRKAGEPGAKLIAFPGTLTRWAAAAAVIVFAGIIALQLRPPAPATIATEQPTILDAFALARRIETGRNLETRFDLNGDGQVDTRDVDVLAQRAVALPGDNTL